MTGRLARVLRAADDRVLRAVGERASALRRLTRVPRGAGGRPMGMGRLAEVLRCTEGQAYTVTIGLVLALVMVLAGVPPTLRDEAPVAAEAGGEQAGTPADTAPPSSPTRQPDEGGTPDEQGPGSEELSLPQAVESPAEGGGGDAPPPTEQPGGGAADDFAPPSGEPGSTPGDDAQFGAGFGDPIQGASVLAEVADPGAPYGVAVDSEGRVHVGTDNALLRGEQGPGQIIRYRPDGQIDASHVIEGQAAQRRHGLKGIAIDDEDRVHVLMAEPASVLRVDLDAGRQDTYAQIPDLPPCAIGADPCSSTGTGPLPRAAAFHEDGSLFVADAGQAIVWRVPAEGGDPQVWHRSADYAGGGPDAGLAGLAFDGDGELVLTVARSLGGGDGQGGEDDPLAPGEDPPAPGQNPPGPEEDPPAAGTIWRVKTTDGGEAGEREVVARTQSGDAPAGVVVGATRRLYVALSGGDALLVLERDGAEAARFESAAMEEAAGVPLDEPSGVALADGSLFVTNTSGTRGESDHWVVFDVEVEDERT